MTVLDTEILGELQDLMVEPNDGGLTWPSLLWTPAEVVSYLNERQRLFMQETQAVVTRVSQGIVPAVPRQTLPQDWIGTRRIAYQPAGFDLQNGLVSFWRHNEAAGLARADSIGPNNLVNSNAVGSAGGVVLGASTFSAPATQFLSIADGVQVGLNPHFGDFSISLWFYMTALSPLSQYVVSKGCFGNFAPEQIGYDIIVNPSGTITVLFGAPPAAVISGVFITNEKVPLNTWTNIVWTVDRDGLMTMTLNGSPVTLSAGSFTTNFLGNCQGDCTGAAAFSLGAASGIGAGIYGLYTTGRIDAVGYWSRVLAPEEVAILYNQGLGRELTTAWFTEHTVPTGQNFQALSPGDQFEMDQFAPTWATAPITRPKLYSDADPQTLEVVLLPPSIGNGTLHLLYVAQPVALTGLGTPFTVPDEFVPTIKWGVAEDMWAKVGRASDPIRAKAAHELWDFGVEAAKALMEGFA